MLLSLLLAAATAFGGSATWNLNPANGGWDVCDAGNWTPATVPNGPEDTATFGVSNTTGIAVFECCCGSSMEVNGIVFTAGASAFTISVGTNNDGPPPKFYLNISGVGITNNSGITQNFVADTFVSAGQIQFTNSATAGSQTAFTNNAENSSYIGPNTTVFFDTSSAGTGIFTNNAGNFGGELGGFTQFFDASTADNATLIANGGSGGLGGTILFGGDSTGGTARVEVFASHGGRPDGNLDISAHNAPGVTVGSIEGSGAVFLGSNNLTVGGNNLTTTFSGIIKDKIHGGTRGGSLTKIGTGTLDLTNANIYTGGTAVSGGKLLVENRYGSGTGSGVVQVAAGTLGGRGTIAGAVTVGTGSGPGAILSPGKTVFNPGTLAILSTLTFGSDAAYIVRLNSATAEADEVIAKGVTINSGAQFFLVDSQASALPPGTVLRAIHNTAATPIAGTFSNLADGSTFTVNANTFQASYEGGDGNDLTLTVQ